MKSRIPRLLVAAGVVALLTAACNVDPQQASQAAERVMTVAAKITPEAVETAMASSPINASAAAVVAEAPLIYARCITRGATALLQVPQDGATEAAALGSRSIITAFGRTADAAWVLGWNAREVRGWLPTTIIGCTAPVDDLRVTDAGVLLTPTAISVAEATTAATAETTSEATSEATQTPPATVMINVVTATPEATLESTSTEAPAPTATALPTDAPIPTTAPTRTALPTATPLAATTAPTSPVRVVTVVVVVTATPAQARDLRCEVTPGTPVNLRNGPAREAKLLDTLPAGTRFLAQGRNTDASWIYGFTERQMPGWLIASSVDCDGDPAQLVEVDR